MTSSCKIRCNCAGTSSRLALVIQEQSTKGKDALTQQLSETQNDRHKLVEKSRAERQVQSDKAKREAQKKQDQKQKEQRQKAKIREKDGTLCLAA